MADRIRLTIWNEFRHEKENARVRELYPEGMHRAIAAGIAADDLAIRCATLDEPEHGLSQEVVDTTDVLIWWGHRAHREVDDGIVERVRKRVLEGMGLIVLHSGHFSKIFKALMGTSCSLRWREVGERERLWVIDPVHPIAQGLPPYFELPNVEMYGERFDVPHDGKLIFLSWYEGGDVFRSGLAFDRGYGKVFYFSPGHETYPIFYDANVLRVIGNAVRWARPVFFRELSAPRVEPVEPIRTVDPAADSGAGIENQA